MKSKPDHNNFRKYGYNKVRDNSKYEKWRNKVRAKYKACVVCGTGSNTEVHHLVPFSIDKNKRYHVSNGRLLCQHHHSLLHNEYSLDECNLKTFNQFVKKYKTNENK